MECDFSITHHMKNKYSKKDFKTELQRSRRLLRIVLDKPAVLSYEELGGLSVSEPRDYVHNVVSTGLRD
jgi:hypothetical protein